MRRETRENVDMQCDEETFVLANGADTGLLSGSSVAIILLNFPVLEFEMPQNSHIGIDEFVLVQRVCHDRPLQRQLVQVYLWEVVFVSEHCPASNGSFKVVVYVHSRYVSAISC